MNELFNNLFIFEMANSHQGSVEHGRNIIREMGRIARGYNINAAVKLQYRDLDTFIHPDYKGRTDIKHIPRFESTRLSREEFDELVNAIREEGMIAMSTPFDENGVDMCMDQGLDIIKIASCSSMDWPLMEKAAATGKPLIVSTGGKTLSDIDKIYNFLTHKGVNFAFLHCIAEYPAPADGLQLDFIDKMKKRYPEVVVGYSGHEDPDDIIPVSLAVAKGAQILERHVGLETEQIKLNAYSMNPQQASAWVKAAITARSMCAQRKHEPSGDTKHVTVGEIDSLRSLMRGVFATHSIAKGDIIGREDVFFAMPCVDRQLTSGEFSEGMVATRDYESGAALFEEKKTTDISIMRSVVHDAKGMLYEAGIALGTDFEVELSHHRGMQHFRQFGAIIISIVNREYCKKLIIVLPGQTNPTHLHKQKEETFQLLYGDLEVTIDNEKHILKPGDTRTVLRGSAHSFTSRTGAIFEEISTTHIRNDSFYSDPAIAKLDPLERKSILRDW